MNGRFPEKDLAPADMAPLPTIISAHFIGRVARLALIDLPRLPNTFSAKIAFQLEEFISIDSSLNAPRPQRHLYFTTFNIFLALVNFKSSSYLKSNSWQINLQFKIPNLQRHP
jgi:hypothetical protein